MSTIEIRGKQISYSEGDRGYKSFCYVVTNYKPTDKGYFNLRFGDSRQYIHRVVASDSYGILLEELDLVRHRCNNPSCINPLHLLVGDSFDNVQDAVEAGSFVSTNCKRGHSLIDPSNVRIVKRKGRNDNKTCIKCENKRNKSYGR